MPSTTSPSSSDSFRFIKNVSELEGMISILYQIKNNEKFLTFSFM